MRDIYIVSYQNGACGAFIASLIYIWLTNRAHPLVFTQYGDAHENENYRENWSRVDSEVYVSNKMLKILEPKHKSLPFVIREHREPNREIVKLKYPNYLNIRITTTSADYKLLTAFIFFKITLRNYNDLNPGPWSRLTKGSYIDPNLLNSEELKYYLSLLEESFLDKNPYWQEENFTKTSESNNEYMLKFNDIIFNKDLVLNYLSKLIEKPIIPVIEQSYKNYINANKNLINLKCPWINF